jgi:hypothetical protein
LLESRLPLVLATNADTSSDELLVRYDDVAADRHRSRIDVPEWVRPFLTPDDSVAIQHNRAYTTLRGAQLGELYSKSKVQAVVLATYLKRLLEESDTGFLTNGKTIHRLVSFPSANEQFELSERGRAQLSLLIDDYNSERSRRIQRVDAPISDEGELQPVYDFALLDFSDEGGGTIVVVAHFVSQSSKIDSASGRSARSEYVVEGYISWRPADVAFYSSLFRELANKAKPFPISPSSITTEDQS